MVSFQGPVRPGMDVDEFRRTGKSKSLFQGPLRPGTDVEEFRRTGKVKPKKSSKKKRSSSKPVLGPTRADFEAEQKRKADIRQQIESKEIARQERISTGKISGQVVGTVTSVPEGTDVFSKFERFRQESETAQLRGEATFLQSQAAGIVGGFASSLIGSGKFAAQLVTSPVETGTAVVTGTISFGRRAFSREGVPEIGQVLSERPGFALGFVAGEIATGKALGSGFSFAGRQASKVGTILDPRFRPATIVDDVTAIRNVPKEGGAFDIELSRGVSSASEPLALQAKLAGTTQDIVTAQRGIFGRIFGKSTVEIQKPLPTPGSPVLETSLFADPRGRLRISRLGIEKQKPATIIDFLSGDVSFTKSKPQALVFPGQTIEQFPAGLTDIKVALESGKPLSTAQQARLTAFQLQPSGKFKPVGFLSVESEVTLAPTEVIRRGETLAVSLIGGRRVPIISTEIVSSTRRTSELLNLDTLSRTSAQTKELQRLLSKETGFTISTTLETSPFVDPLALFGATSFLTGKRSFKFSTFVPTTGDAPSVSRPSVSSADFSTGVSFSAPSPFAPSSPSGGSGGSGGSPFSPISPVTPVSPVSPVSPTPDRGRSGIPVSPALGSLGDFGAADIFGDPFGQTLRDKKRKKKKKKTARKRALFGVSPSLTGVALFDLGNITGGPLPTSGLPGLSLVPRSSVKKKKVKKKKKKR